MHTKTKINTESPHTMGGKVDHNGPSHTYPLYIAQLNFKYKTKDLIIVEVFKENISKTNRNVASLITTSNAKLLPCVNSGECFCQLVD